MTVTEFMFQNSVSVLTTANIVICYIMKMKFIISTGLTTLRYWEGSSSILIKLSGLEVLTTGWWNFASTASCYGNY